MSSKRSRPSPLHHQPEAPRLIRSRRSRPASESEATVDAAVSLPDVAPREIACGAEPGAATILRLQQVHGNHHVARLLAPAAAVQRLPQVKRGSEGAVVRDLQEKLNEGVPSPEPPLAVDGVAGTKTVAAIAAFQQRNGLVPDGIVGPLTWDMLSGKKRTPAKEGATAPLLPTPLKQEPVKADAGKAAQGADAAIDKALATVAANPEGDALPGDFVEQQLDAAFREYSEVLVVVRGTADKAVVPPRTLRVHTPYFINVNDKSAEMSKQVHAAATKARGQKAVKTFFQAVAKDETLSGDRDKALIGKASPKHIQGILQAALDQGIIHPQDAANPTADDLRIWLRTHGIGVDCSGFVSHALTRVMEQSMHAQGIQGPVQEIYKGSTGLKGGSEGFAAVGKDKTCTGPRCLQPGDTMYIPGHIRIVSKVEQRDGGVEFTTLESYAGGKERVGMARARWFYPDEAKFTGLQIKRGDADWKKVAEKPVFGRLEALGAMNKGE